MAFAAASRDLGATDVDDLRLCPTRRTQIARVGEPRGSVWVSCAVSRVQPAQATSDSRRPGRRACSTDLGANLRSPSQITEILGAQIHDIADGRAYSSDLPPWRVLREGAGHRTTAGCRAITNVAGQGTSCEVTLHIEHPITDYSTWRTAFDSFADARRNAGVVGERVTRPIDDVRYIVVGLDFESIEQAAAFRHFLETQVWSSPAASPGLDGQPRTAILQPV